MKKFFGFGSSTPPPPPPPMKPPAPPPAKTAAAAPSKSTSSASSQHTAGPDTPSIVGRWKAPDSNDTTEFHADGRVTESNGTGEAIHGRYSLRAKVLKINLNGVPDELSFRVSVGEQTLEMTESDGKITHYKRA